MSDLGPLMVDVAGTRLDETDRRLLCRPEVGAVILFARNYESPAQLAALCEEVRALRTPRLLIAADYEGGRVQRFRDGFTRLPPMARLGAVYDRDPDEGVAAARDCGRVIGAELAAVGIDLPFAPVLDLNRGDSEVIGDRAFHRDPRAVAALGRAFHAGLRDAGLAATGKHFPGHGSVAADSHLELPRDERDPSALAEDVLPFQRLIDAGLESIMMAHVTYPAVCDRPASLSPIWIRERLRGVLGFSGAVFCDDLSMGGAAVLGGYAERVEAALAAGCDVLPICNNRDAVTAVLDDERLGDWPPVTATLTRLQASPRSAALDDDTLADARRCVRSLVREGGNAA